MLFSEWLDPSYLDYSPFVVLTEKAIWGMPLQIRSNQRKPPETRIFTFTQGIGGYSGRVNWYCVLVLSIQQFTAQGEERVLSQMKTPVFYMHTWCSKLLPSTFSMLNTLCCAYVAPTGASGLAPLRSYQRLTNATCTLTA